MSRGFAFSHVLLCKIFNVHCGSTSEIFSVARKGRKQVSNCGHKFSMLEKLLSTQSSLLGQALVGAKPLHLLTQTALPLKSPTGAFIATLRSANAVAPNAKLKIIFPLNMARAKRKPFQIVLPVQPALNLQIKFASFLRFTAIFSNFAAM